MEQLDFQIIRFFNKFSRHSPEFDHLVALWSSSTLVKGPFYGMIIWWAWFTEDDHTREN